MTNQEVIETLKTAMAEVEWGYPIGYAAAFDMAIKALEKQDDPDTNVGKWISVKDRMPPERETIFAKLNGTKQWNPSMFMKSSDDVRVAVRFEDGTRMVTHDHTFDGKWYSEKEGNAYPKRTVTHWMPNPDLPKEE